MRKTIFVLIFFLFLLFQSVIPRIFPQIVNYFFLPNLPLILLTFVSLYGGPEKGIITGFFTGFFEDSLSSGLMGGNALIKTLLGFIAGISSQQFYVANRIIQFIIVIILTIFNNIGREILNTFLNSNVQNISSDFTHLFFFITIPEAILNGLLALLLFPFFERIQLIKMVDNQEL